MNWEGGCNNRERVILLRSLSANCWRAQEEYYCRTEGRRQPHIVNSRWTVLFTLYQSSSHTRRPRLDMLRSTHSRVQLTALLRFISSIRKSSCPHPKPVQVCYPALRSNEKGAEQTQPQISNPHAKTMS